METPFLGNRYEIQQRLSRKPGRQTYLAFDRQTQDRVIVKLLIFGYDFDWNDLALFEREANILRTLNHPAIPQYRDSFDLDLPNLKGFAFVQTYIDAKSLEAHLQAHRTFSETEVKQIAEDILGVLIYLHSQNPPVIHRDIKPSNILLTSNRSGHSAGQVYVVDFGSVQNSVSVEGCTWTITGTYGYASPEQFSGRATPISDLYSLGATLIHLVTGQHPADLPEQDLRIQFDQTIDLSPSLKRWLRQMTEPSLKRRFSTSREALQALQTPSEIEGLAVGKPARGKISLTKTAEELHILIPPLSVRQKPNRPKLLERARKSSLPSFARSLSSPLSILVHIVAGVYYTFSALFVLFFLLFAIFIPIIGVSILFWILMSPFMVMMSYSQTRLLLIKNENPDQDLIALSHEFLGMKLSKSSALLQRGQIRLQKLDPKIVEEYRGKQISARSALSELIIWVENQKFALSDLTPSELSWLSQELSDWLEIPVERSEISMIQRVLSKEDIPPV